MTAEQRREERRLCSVPRCGPKRRWCPPRLALNLSRAPKWPAVNHVVAKTYPRVATVGLPHSPPIRSNSACGTKRTGGETYRILLFTLSPGYSDGPEMQLLTHISTSSDGHCRRKGTPIVVPLPTVWRHKSPRRFLPFPTACTGSSPLPFPSLPTACRRNGLYRRVMARDCWQTVRKLQPKSCSKRNCTIAPNEHLRNRTAEPPVA